ncbi:MAG: integrase arm-type DNA-binding domain-containing protein [bacterium]|nr:integrase arm-type DNA-binding domain-containing protein [bacterium]
MGKLTDKEIAACRYPEHKGRHADGGGLFLEVMTGGRKRWLYRYRIKKDGKWSENTLVLGDYPAMTLAKARIEHMRQKAILTEGGNPSTARKEARAAVKQDEEQQEADRANSFEAIALEWVALKGSGWRASHTRATRRSLENHVFPHLGPTPVDKITPPLVLEVVRAIEAEGALEMASKILQRIGAVFRFAIQTGRAAYNPAADMRGALKAKKAKHHPLLDKGRATSLLSGLARRRYSPGNQKCNTVHHPDRCQVCGDEAGHLG